MARASWAACAGGAVLLLAVGCSVDQLRVGYLQTGGGKDRVVAASLDSVSASMQAALGDLGLVARVTRDGETVRIAYQTKVGGKFTLVLTRVQTDKGESTRVRVEGDGGNDQTHLQVMARLDERTTGK